MCRASSITEKWKMPRLLRNNMTVLVVPLLRGAGIRVKIVESFSLGIPVVSTTMGVQGLEIINHNSLIQADRKDLADCPDRFLKSPERLKQLSEAGSEAADTLLITTRSARICWNSMDNMSASERSLVWRF